MEYLNHEFVSSIASDVMTCLGRSGYFEKLDDVLSPQDVSHAPQSCERTFKLSESILLASGFEQGDLADIFAVLQSKGGNCDCEVLYNVSETNRLKAKYWRDRAAGLTTETPHAPKLRTD
jgi:hypothetical protein